MKNKIRTIIINGIKTNVVLPRGMKSEELPKSINTNIKDVKGLIFDI